jgi:hypothetical protein
MTRVRVDGFSNTNAMDFPARGCALPAGICPRFMALARSRIWRTVAASSKSRSRKCFGGDEGCFDMA